MKQPAPKPWRWVGVGYWQFQVDNSRALTVDVVKSSATWARKESYVELDTDDTTYTLSPDDAEALGRALIERAQWLREHGESA